MRLLVFSDVHGDQSIISKIRQEAKNCDLILCCGDITPVHGKPLDTARQIGKFDVQLLAIPGNFERPNDMEEICKELGWINLHGKHVEINGLGFAGCGGGNISPFNTPYELTDEQFKEILKKFTIRDRFVFLSHCPSKGFVDKVRSGTHVGSAAIEEFVRKTQPILQFCGHIHEEGGREAMHGKTRICNVARQVKLIDV